MKSQDTGLFSQREPLQEGRKILSHYYERLGCNAELNICDDGYSLKVQPITSDFEIQDFHERVEKIEVPNYEIVERFFKSDSVNLLLVPVTSESMNDFVWTYIETFYSDIAEIEALTYATATLENMIYSLESIVSDELLKKYLSELDKYLCIIS